MAAGGCASAAYQTSSATGWNQHVRIQPRFLGRVRARIATEELRTHLHCLSFRADVAPGVDEAAHHGVVHAVAATAFRTQYGVITMSIKRFAAQNRTFGI